jgi:hypothetical protein
MWIDTRVSGEFDVAASLSTPDLLFLPSVQCQRKSADDTENLLRRIILDTERAEKIRSRALTGRLGRV